MLKGRLGLETARIPHADRAGLLWLSRGALTARDGTLSFERGPQWRKTILLIRGTTPVRFRASP
jgi:CRISPR-associated protein Cas1